MNSFRTLLLLSLALFPLLLAGHSELPGDMLPYASRFTETNPPIAPVRPVAEFEPASHALIRYPLGIPVSLVAQLANTAQVICIVASSSVQNQAISAFTAAGVNMAQVTFMIAATDSYWTRDYGPLFAFDGNDELGVVDFQYNRPRPNDNMIPQVFANYFGLDYYGMNLKQTGGNYMTDGINTAAQTTIAYTENPSQTQAQINTKMRNYLGITNHQVLNDPNNTYIDHIDCWGKFLAPDKVLIRSVPTSHAQYSAIEQTAAYFANLNCAWGYPYKVYRVFTPQNQPYINSLILNKRVFVPTMGSANDAAALQSYRNALPGYDVVGIPGGPEIWESTDALHCRVHEIPDQDMLHIGHTPWWGTQNSTGALDFNATIKAHSGQALYPDSVYVRYQVNSGPWQNSLLVNIFGSSYTTLLGGFAPGDTIRYYLHAADQSGRVADHPFTAALDPHVFTIAADTQAPAINHTPLTEIHSGETLIDAVVTDNAQVTRVLLRYQIDQGEVAEAELMTDSAAPPNLWWVNLDLQFTPGQAFFQYQLQAWDAVNNAVQYPANGDWISVPISEVAVGEDLLPASDTAITSLYPNPFQRGRNSALTLVYQSKQPLPARLKIFNIKGQLVAWQYCDSLIPGANIISWSGLDSQQKKVAPGVYLFQLDIGAKRLTRKALILD